MGTPVSVKTGQAGSQIKGAIQSVKAPAPPKQDVARGVTVPAATIKTNQQLSPSAARAAMGDVAPTRSIYKTVAEADRAIVAKATQTYNQRFGTNYTPDQYSRLAKTVAGEAAGESDFARAAVANTFGNRTALAQQEGSPYGYMGGGDFASLVGQYDAYRMQNDPYRAAVPGSKTYQQGVNAMYQAINPESTFSKTASPKVLTATHYYNPAEVRREPDWAGDKTKFERVGSHLFGTAEASQKAVSKARAEQLARSDVRIVPTSSTLEESNITTPRTRPPSQNMQRPPSVGRSAVDPTSRKIITDRITPEYERISSDPTLEGKRLKQTYDRLIPEDPVLRQRMGEIAAQSPSYFVQGAPDERMLYNTSPKTLDRMKQVFDRSRGMSYTPSLPAQPSYFGDVPDFKPSTPSKSYFGDIGGRVVATPSRSYFGDVGDRTVAPPVRPSYPKSEYSGYGATGYSTLSGIPTPDSTELVGPAPSYGGVLGMAQSGFNALSDALKMPPETARALRDWGLAKGIETPKSISEGAMSLVPDSYADSGFAKAATPFAESLRNKVVSGVSGLQESYKNALSEAQKKSQPATTDSIEPNGVTSEDDMPSVDTGTTKISVGPKLATIDKIVEDQKNLTKQEKDELKQILSDAAAANIVEWSTDNFKATIDEARRNIASGESPSSPKAQPAPKGGYPLTSMGTAPVVDMPQISLTPEQAEEVGNRVERGKTAIRGAGTGVSLVTGVPGLGGFLGGKYEESVKKKLDNYVLATPEQRAEMERKDPSLTAWAGIIGETPQLDRSNYTNWAEKSGLRAPPSREGGRDNSGIASLVDKSKGDETTTPTPDTPSTTPGRRPDIYYMWDLGVNVPSPGDPNYTQYQTYLAERLSARQAVG
jgi:spore germination cell wall hydrolase CwlJ-like protein